MENKTSKYLKYAVGEIILVVIGILIALQINNWNENRKINNDVERIFTLLEKELETNILQSSRFVNYGYRLDSVQNLFYKQKVTPELIKANPSLMNRDFSTNTIYFLDDRLDEIISAEKQLSSEYQNLIPDLKNLKKLINEHRFWEKRALDLAAKKQEEYINKFTWYGRTDSLSFDKAIKNSLTDSIYRNNVNHYLGLQLNENVWYASLMRTTAVAVLWQIKTIKEPKTELNIEQFFKDLELKPLVEYSCSDKPYKINEINFRRNFIVYNNSNDSITVHSIDAIGTRLSDFTIASKKFLLGFYTLPNNHFIELTKDDQCSKVYKLNKEDYLVLE